ncbi:MAG: hypothetical protein IPL50_09795 [Chitinophagaceae bacterium]|nr:hypothetical protein [Chitinophagaceae bacterium]
MNKPVVIFFIVAFNLVPIFGVVFFKWQPFEAFWFFWVETLIIAFFNSIRIVFSQNQQQATLNTGSPHMYHISKAIKYLLLRIGIFLFYSIFIITFIGFVANNNTDKSTVLTTLVFQNRFFNLSLLISIFSQTYYLVFYFFRNGTFFTASPDRYAALFDSRQLVIHFAVVLGAFGSIYLVKNTSFGNYSSAFIISLLCVCKCAAELFNYKTAAIGN